MEGSGQKPAGKEKCAVERDWLVITSEPSTHAVGELVLDLIGKAVQWKGKSVRLTKGEFDILHSLAMKPGKNVPYRDIYDTFRSPGFQAGDGEDGYRANVRTLIKRIRLAFCKVDEAFEEIKTHNGVGYRWGEQAPILQDTL